MGLRIENRVIVQDYDARQLPFPAIFSEFCRDAFGSDDVEQMHRFVPNPTELVKVGEDQKTFAVHALYKIDPAFRPTDVDLAVKVVDRGFIRTYLKLIALLETETFGEKLVFQARPTLRAHLPNNLSVGAYHRDRDYNHPIEEINIWVPVTRASGTATIQIEASSGSRDYRPIDAGRGQLVIFDSALEHGNEVNREGYTRVSFDFRVIPLSRYQESDSASFNERRKFRIGDYYSLL